MKEIEGIFWGKFYEEATFLLDFNADRNELKNTIYKYFKTQNINQLTWSDQDPLTVWIESRRFNLSLKNGEGKLILTKETKYNYWGFYHVIGILILINNLKLLDNNYFMAATFYIAIFMILYAPIRNREKRIWYKAVGVIEGCTGLSVKN
jgi:hypothetical protein